MRCTFCKKDLKRCYWQRTLPDACLCLTCWTQPDVLMAARTERYKIASILRQARRENRATAKAALMHLRGRGIQPNLARRRKLDEDKKNEAPDGPCPGKFLVEQAAAGAY